MMLMIFYRFNIVENEVCLAFIKLTKIFGLVLIEILAIFWAWI